MNGYSQLGAKHFAHDVRTVFHHIYPWTITNSEISWFSAQSLCLQRSFLNSSHIVWFFYCSQKLTINILNKALSCVGHKIIPSFLRLFIPLFHSSQKNWILEKDERQKLLSQGVEKIRAEKRLHANRYSWERRQLLSQLTLSTWDTTGAWHIPHAGLVLWWDSTGPPLQPCSTQVFTCGHEGSTSTMRGWKHCWLKTFQAPNVGGKGQVWPWPCWGDALPCTPHTCIPALQWLPIPGTPEATLHTHLWSF